MVKSVLFDLDNTLLDRDASVKQFITAQYDRLAAHLNYIPQTDYVSRFIELDCHGHTWKDRVYQDLVQEFAIESICWQALLEDYETQFQFYCQPFRFLTETLDTLKQQGYLLGIVTNGRGQIQNRSIDGLGIRDAFDTFLISAIEQVRKPEPEIFCRAAQQLGVAVQDSVFIGNNPEADILGAKRVGMKTIWKRDSYWLETTEADAIIDELNEIPSILEQFNHTTQEKVK